MESSEKIHHTVLHYYLMVLCCSSTILSRPNYLRDPLGYYGFTQIQSKLYSLLATLSYLFYFWCAVLIFFFAILLLHNRFLSISKKKFDFGRWSEPRLIFSYLVIYTSSEVCLLDFVYIHILHTCTIILIFWSHFA